MPGASGWERRQALNNPWHLTVLALGTKTSALATVGDPSNARVICMHRMIQCITTGFYVEVKITTS